MFIMRCQILLICICFIIHCTKGQDPCGDFQPQILEIFTSGSLYSPGFEQKKNYPDNIKCSVQLQAPYSMYIRLKFNEFDIDVTDSCMSDQLDIYDFDSNGRGIFLSRHCGNKLPNDYITTANYMQLIFRSDGFVSGKGYNITYTVTNKPDLCPSNQITCRNRNCIQRSSSCNGVDDCGDGTDEEKCGVVPITSSCGRPEISPKALADFDRIVGGDAVVPGSWPWMVSMQQRVVEPNSQVCGGSLINAQWVLAAAHCFGDIRNPSGWRIHLGMHKKFEKDPYEQVRYVERFIIYDDINPVTFESNGEFDIVNDVALVKLNAPVKFTKFVKPICLPDVNARLNSSTSCYATGWGITRGSGYSEVLKQARHPIQLDNVCKKLVGSQFVPDTMICAGSMQPKNGVCHGDSGGPLACEINKVWSIFGVASYVTDTNFIDGLCGLSGRPSVFNKVSKKLDWITRMINKYN